MERLKTSLAASASGSAVSCSPLRWSPKLPCLCQAHSGKGAWQAQRPVLRQQRLAGSKVDVVERASKVRSTGPNQTSTRDSAPSSASEGDNAEHDSNGVPVGVPSILQSLESELADTGSLSSADGAEGAAPSGTNPAAWAATIGFVAGLGLLLAGGYVFQEPIKAFLQFFIDAVDEWGVWGYVAYAAVYTGLEVLAVPAVPLTMTAGVIFGPLAGTAVVSFSGTLAAAIAFLIARYAARDKVLKFAQRNKRFAAVDRAISRNGLKFVTLLRLSPLLPLAVSNYLYGLTSVDLSSYVLGSWLGMLPGTYAYVTAGHVGKAVLVEGGEGSLGLETWQIALGLGATALALGFIGQIAKKAVEEADQEVLMEKEQQKAAQQGQAKGPQ